MELKEGSKNSVLLLTSYLGGLGLGLGRLCVKWSSLSLLAHRENVCLPPPSEITELLPAGFLFVLFLVFVLLLSQT